MIMESEARVECCVGARVCVVWYDIVEAKCARGAEEKREKHEKSTRAFWFLVVEDKVHRGCVGVGSNL
jgi:hypothetical protein